MNLHVLIAILFYSKTILLKRNIMKHLLAQIITLFIVQSVFSQSSNDRDILQVYPPNAYALARYGEIPIDYSTGVPDISIPLMSISDRDITVDLSLSYHARGLKIDQEATWVGLGWVLNAGGVITRDIRDRPDIGNQERPIIEDFVPDRSSPLNYEKSLNKYLSTAIYNVQSLAGSREDVDGESDMYYFNFNGKSGKFFIDNNNNVCLVKHDDLKIEINHESGTVITIINDLGVKYIFDEPSYIVQRAKTYVTSWYLKKIISPQGGEISFEYRNKACPTTAMRNNSVCFIDASTNTGSLSVHEGTNHAGNVSSSTVNEPLLSKIVTKSGHYINLSVSAEKRKDTENMLGVSLNKISLYNVQNELQKGVELNYGYFEANTNRRYKDQNNKEQSSLNYLNYRLRLESVKEFSKSNEYASTYRFEYYGDNNPVTDDVYTLPYRLSPCQDHWGYYNYSYNKVIFPGNSDNSYYSVEVDLWYEWFLSRMPYESVALGKSSKVYGADRKPNAEAVKAGTLNKIIYPTGGYSKFDFEVNNESGSIRGGLRIKQIETCDNNGKIIRRKYRYDGFIEDFVYIDMSRNAYMAYLYNPLLYDIGSMGAPDNYNNSTIRQTLSAIGVPPGLVYNENYNILDAANRSGTYLKTVKIDGFSSLRLGLEGETSYSKVIEETEGLGKAEYYYTNCSNQYDGEAIVDNDNVIKQNAFISGWMRTRDLYWQQKDYSCMSSNSFTFPYPSSVDYGWKSRLLTCKRIFDKNERIIEEDSIFYTTKILHVVPNYKVFALSEYEYMYTRSYTVGGMVNINKEVKKQYISEEKVIRTSNEYSYLSPYHKKITEKKTDINREGNVTEKYYYPTEYGSYFETLIQKNILNPIDVRSYRNGKLISGIQVQYDSSGLPLIKYKSESTGADIVFNKSVPFTFTPFLWNEYNTGNLLISQRTNNNVTSVYLWSYGGQHPIAEIKNATYANVVNVLTKVFLDRLSSTLTPTDSDMKTLNGLRSKLPDAYITTYSFKPLIGLLSITDPRGITTYYDYDSFGRLQNIYVGEQNAFGNPQKKILQHYKYHYHNQ